MSDLYGRSGLGIFGETGVWLRDLYHAEKEANSVGIFSIDPSSASDRSRPNTQVSNWTPGTGQVPLVIGGHSVK